MNSKFYKNVLTKGNNGRNPFSDIHKALMPQELADEIIYEFTQEGETILDPFMGCGTTGVACVNANRNYIGFEICKEYCNIANERIDLEKSQERWF